MKPRAVSRVFKAAFMIAIVLGLLILSPMGEKLLESMPFTGHQPDATFTYRQRLLDRSLELIQENPLFGDQLALQKMEDLRQGQGIIDIVNTYVGVALFSGYVGLALFLGFICSASLALYRTARSAISSDPERSLLGFNLLACILGVLFAIAGCSFIMGVQKIFYVLIALAVAYARHRTQANHSVPERTISNGVASKK